MDALKFIEERNRMCKSFSPDCEGCRIDEAKPVVSECVSWMIDNAEKAVQIVEQWSQEHPRKTRQDVFLEQWPNCMMGDDGIVGMCPRNIDKMYVCNLSRFGGCQDCRRNFWMQEVE